MKPGKEGGVDSKVLLNARKIACILLSGCRVIRPILEAYPQVLEELDSLLGAIGINYGKLYEDEGREVYGRNRFQASFAATALRVLGIHPNLRFPDKEFELSILEYFNLYPTTFRRLHEVWRSRCEDTHILTPPSFLPSMESVSGQVERFIQYGWGGVDVYSSTWRYSEMWKLLLHLHSSKLFSPSVVLEVGSAGGDNILQAHQLFGNSIQYRASDILPLDEVVKNPMMEEYRFQAKHLLVNHLRQISEAEISFSKVDVFNKTQMDSFFDGVQNSCIFCLNVLFPHFDEEYLTNGIHQMLMQNPRYLVIGGGVPMFEQEINGHYLPGWHTRIFEILEDNSIRLLGHTVDGLVKVQNPS